MGEYARLSPEERDTARENFRSAYELPADKRQEKLQQYQDLPDEKKRALAEQAEKKQKRRKPHTTRIYRRSNRADEIASSLDSLSDRTSR